MPHRCPFRDARTQPAAPGSVVDAEPVALVVPRDAADPPAPRRPHQLHGLHAATGEGLAGLDALLGVAAEVMRDVAELLGVARELPLVELLEGPVGEDRLPRRDEAVDVVDRGL